MPHVQEACLAGHRGCVASSVDVWLLVTSGRVCIGFNGSECINSAHLHRS